MQAAAPVSVPQPTSDNTMLIVGVVVVLIIIGVVIYFLTREEEEEEEGEEEGDLPLSDTEVERLALDAARTSYEADGDIDAAIAAAEAVFTENGRTITQTQKDNIIAALTGGPLTDEELEEAAYEAATEYIKSNPGDVDGAVAAGIAVYTENGFDSDLTVIRAELEAFVINIKDFFEDLNELVADTGVDFYNKVKELIELNSIEENVFVIDSDIGEYLIEFFIEKIKDIISDFYESDESVSNQFDLSTNNIDISELIGDDSELGNIITDALDTALEYEHYGIILPMFDGDNNFIQSSYDTNINNLTTDIDEFRTQLNTFEGKEEAYNNAITASETEETGNDDVPKLILCTDPEVRADIISNVEAIISDLEGLTDFRDGILNTIEFINETFTGKPESPGQDFINLETEFGELKVKYTLYSTTFNNGITTLKNKNEICKIIREIIDIISNVQTLQSGTISTDGTSELVIPPGINLGLDLSFQTSYLNSNVAGILEDLFDVNNSNDFTAGAASVSTTYVENLTTIKQELEEIENRFEAVDITGAINIKYFYVNTRFPHGNDDENANHIKFKIFNNFGGLQSEVVSSDGEQYMFTIPEDGKIQIFCGNKSQSNVTIYYDDIPDCGQEQGSVIYNIACDDDKKLYVNKEREFSSNEYVRNYTTCIPRQEIDEHEFVDTDISRISGAVVTGEGQGGIYGFADPVDMADYYTGQSKYVGIVKGNKDDIVYVRVPEDSTDPPSKYRSLEVLPNDNDNIFIVKVPEGGSVVGIVIDEDKYGELTYDAISIPTADKRVYVYKFEGSGTFTDTNQTIANTREDVADEFVYEGTKYVRILRQADGEIPGHDENNILVPSFDDSVRAINPGEEIKLDLNGTIINYSEINNFSFYEERAPDIEVKYYNSDATGENFVYKATNRTVSRFINRAKYLTVKTDSNTLYAFVIDVSKRFEHSVNGAYVLDNDPTTIRLFPNQTLVMFGESDEEDFRYLNYSDLGVYQPLIYDAEKEANIVTISDGIDEFIEQVTYEHEIPKLIDFSNLTYDDIFKIIVTRGEDGTTERYGHTKLYEEDPDNFRDLEILEINKEDTVSIDTRTGKSKTEYEYHNLTFTYYQINVRPDIIPGQVVRVSLGDNNMNLEDDIENIAVVREGDIPSIISVYRLIKPVAVDNVQVAAQKITQEQIKKTMEYIRSIFLNIGSIFSD